MPSIQPNSRRLFIADALSEAANNEQTLKPYSTEKIRIMGICVDIGEVSGNVSGKATTWINFVLDDGTSFIDVLLDKSIQGLDISPFQCGQSLDVVGSIGKIGMQNQDTVTTTMSDLVTSPCIFADLISINRDPNSDTLRFLEVIRSKEKTQHSILPLQSGLYMAPHILEIVSPFGIVKDPDLDPNIDPHSNKLAIDRSRAYQLIKCSDRHGVTEAQLASLLGCYQPDQCEALKQLLTEMQLAFEIFRNGDGAYICL